MQNYLYRILRWSERYTRTDMVYLAKGGFWTGVKRVFGIPLGIGLSIALANLLTPEDFGVYKFVLAFAGIITAFSLTGMSTAVMQAVAQGYEGAGVRSTIFTTTTRYSGRVCYSLQHHFHSFTASTSILHS